MKAKDITHDDVVALRNHAETIYASVLLLEAMDIHPSWERGNIEDYFIGLVNQLELAEEVVKGAVHDLGREAET